MVEPHEIQAGRGTAVTGAPPRGVSTDEYLLGWGPLGVFVVVLLSAVVVLWKQRNADLLRYEQQMKEERAARHADALRHEQKMYEMVDAAQELIGSLEKKITPTG